MSFKSIILTFLKQYNPEQKPFLVALSGGPDSMALFHSLVRIFRHKKDAFAVAHVDHQWRQESRKESDVLENLAKKHGIQIFIRRLDPEKFQGNLEEYCRIQRLDFFKQLIQSHGFAAAMLAHHADDLAEGVFKRFFEGKSLPFLRGIKPESLVNEVKLWRPLLQIRKEKLIEWLDQNSYEYFVDATNHDPRFLRARMRRDLFPALEESFGKEVVPSFLRISEESQELESFFDELIRPLEAKISKSDWGTATVYFAELDGSLPGSWVVTTHFLRRWMEKMKCVFPGSLLKEAAKHLHEQKAPKQWEVGRACLFIDRCRLFFVFFEGEKFFLKNKCAELESGQLGKKGGLHSSSQAQPSTFCGAIDRSREALNWDRAAAWKCWKLTSQDEIPSEPSSGGWKEVIRGKVELSLPRGNYRLINPEECMDRMKKLWTERQVPAFMRYLVPLIMDEHGNVYEALSGRYSYDFHRIKKGTRVILEFSSKDSFC